MKHLIFYIWAYPQIRENPLYWVHIRCLSKYISIFNDVSFYIVEQSILSYSLCVPMNLMYTNCIVNFITTTSL